MVHTYLLIRSLNSRHGRKEIRQKLLDIDGIETLRSLYHISSTGNLLSTRLSLKLEDWTITGIHQSFLNRFNPSKINLPNKGLKGTYESLFTCDHSTIYSNLVSLRFNNKKLRNQIGTKLGTKQRMRITLCNTFYNF